MSSKTEGWLRFLFIAICVSIGFVLCSYREKPQLLFKADKSDSQREPEPEYAPTRVR